jgi:hypothetical protein
MHLVSLLHQSLSRFSSLYVPTFVLLCGVMYLVSSSLARCEFL